MVTNIFKESTPSFMVYLPARPYATTNPKTMVNIVTALKSSAYITHVFNKQNTATKAMEP
jgi:hypothetical protein